jgi:hypothetical protein
MVTQMGEKNDMTQRDDTPHQVAHELPEAQRMIEKFRIFASRLHLVAQVRQRIKKLLYISELRKPFSVGDTRLHFITGDVFEFQFDFVATKHINKVSYTDPLSPADIYDPWINARNQFQI